ncbi:MAG: DUF4145 domain-containing protein [Thermoguttaceae bacterium]
MSDVIHWTCPYCNRHATLQDADRIIKGALLAIQEPAEGHKYLTWQYVVCPNPKCKKYTLSVAVHDSHWGVNQWVVGATIKTWNLIPPSLAKSYPDFIPKPIIDDYNEACLIVDLSPKASATLSRRCLQGILRDYWRVKAGRLIDEIEQIKDKTDPATWDAIDSVRKIGNIGAHMQKDIDLIVDVDPDEARILIGLIEMLFEDWYIVRAERADRLTQIKAIADSKLQKKSDMSE